MKKMSYLEQVHFDKKLTTSFVARYLNNPRLLILLVLTILIVGIISFSSIPKRLNPEIKIPIVSVATVLPGASPNDVESLVTIPIEDAVTGVDRVKTVSSSSRDSVSVTTLEFDSGVDPDKARTDVQSAIDTVTLPTDALTPKVQKFDFENQPVWTFTLTTSRDAGSLIRFSKQLHDKLRDLSTVEKVETTGLDEQEIQIVIKPEAITSFGINPQALSGIIGSAVKSFPAGTVRTTDSSFTLSIDPAAASVDDFRNLMLTINGQGVPLSQVATIIERSKPDQKQSFWATSTALPRNAVTFNVFKTGTADIDTAVNDAENATDNLLATQEKQFTVSTILNTGNEINDQFSELIRDFWITITLIVIVLFIFLGARQALVAALSAPLTFLITFSVMKITGISLNFLSMFSLLLSLGLLVDDTIVVISAMTAYHRTGRFTPLQTGLLVWRDFVVAIFTTTITTVWAFLPLLLSSGIIGEFIKSIPIVVSTTLLGSFFVAMFITLPFIIILLKPQIPQRVSLFLKIFLFLALVGVFLFIIPKGPLFIFEILAFIIFMIATNSVRLALVHKSLVVYQKQTRSKPTVRNIPNYFSNGIIHFDRVAIPYRRLIGKILESKNNRRRAIAMVIIFSLFSYMLLPLGFVKNEFFPKSDNNFVYLTLELPAGTNLTKAKEEGIRLLNDIRQTPESEFASAELGQTVGENGAAGGENNNVLLTLKLLPKNDRKHTSIEIAENLRNKFASYQKGKLNVVEISGGPPAGADLQIKLFGDDLKTLDAYANRLEAFLSKQKGVTNIDKSIKPGTSKLVFVPDKEKVAAAELTPDALGYWLRLFASGFSTSTVKLPDDSNTSTDITIRMASSTMTPEMLNTVTISGKNGNTPIMSLGSLRLETNPTLISREGGKRTISVTAGVSKGYSVSGLNKSLENFANTKLALSPGYSWQTGGVNEENTKSVQSILAAMGLSFLLIIVTMVLQFGSFRKALIVMTVIPLSISGVFIIFALTQTPLSFPALIGILALFGIVVKNSILIVDKIKQNTAFGMPFTDAIIDGSSSRLEAIALTSFTAIIGLIPITLSNPLWQGLGGAIISGLTFSGTIMLFFIPIVYYYWFHPKPQQNK